MDKDAKGLNEALAVPRSVSVTATATMTPDQELVDASTIAGGAAITLTLPSVAEATRNRDYMVRFIAKNTTLTVTVQDGGDSWKAISAALTAVGDYVVLRSNGRTWYIVDSVLT